jgi:hypothetical protein
MNPKVGEILDALFAGVEGVIEFRAFEPARAGCTARLFAPVGDARIREFFVEHRTRNLFWGVATRSTNRGGALADCHQLPALFCDLDFKMSSEAVVRDVLQHFPLRPTLIVASGGGLQPYWAFREPVDVQQEGHRVRDLLRRLAAHLKGDLAAAEAARVLRVVGSFNRKYDPPRLVRVMEFSPERRYNLGDFDWLPAVPVAASSHSIDLSMVVAELRNQTLYRLARALKGKKLPSRAIDVTVRSVNAQCCAPPLDEREVDQVLRNALSQADRPRSPRIIEVA